MQKWMLKLAHKWQHNHVLRQVRARPRLFIAAAFGLLVAQLLPPGVATHDVARWLIAWNSGTLLYLVLAAVMMIRSSHHLLRHRAQLQDEGQWVMLVLVMVSAVASMVAIFMQLSIAKDMKGGAKLEHVGLAGVTVLLSWAFTHTMMALHYAHDYYASVCRSGKQEDGGLDFPNDRLPDYGDFLYFALVIGTSGQTADVAFTSKTMRRVGTVHCVLSFLFNVVVLALSINIASGLL